MARRGVCLEDGSAPVTAHIKIVEQFGHPARCYWPLPSFRHLARRGRTTGHPASVFPAARGRARAVAEVFFFRGRRRSGAHRGCAWEARRRRRGLALGRLLGPIASRRCSLLTPARGGNTSLSFRFRGVDRESLKLSRHGLDAPVLAAHENKHHHRPCLDISWTSSARLARGHVVPWWASSTTVDVGRPWQRSDKGQRCQSGRGPSLIG